MHIYIFIYIGYWNISANHSNQMDQMVWTNHLQVHDFYYDLTLAEILPFGYECRVPT